MADFIDFPEANLTWKAPPGAKNIQDLRVHRTDRGENISCWELDDTDIDILIQTRRLYLAVIGDPHPPVYITVTPPFETVSND